MNRRRTATSNKSFVSGGVYDPSTPTTTPIKKPIQQQNTPQRQPQQLDSPDVSPVQQNQQSNVVPPLEPPPENPFRESSMTLDTSGIVDENGKVKFKKIFMTRKKASVRTKEKRIRQNRRLRKTLIPKNGLMALNELKGVSISDFTINNNPGGGFTALVTVNNSQYEGRGNSKAAAKNNACEKALRDFIIAKLRENPRNQKNANNSSNNSVCNEPMDTSDDNTPSQANAVDDDEVPMINLASFAIYKLFSDWESEGYVIPEMHPSTGGSTSDNEGGTKEPKKAPIRNELPPNWEAMHPASLLCVMRPGVVYVDKGTIGEKPNMLQSLGINVDDQEFVATGRSKKLARRNVAALTCNTLFNTNFELDIKFESTSTSSTPAPEEI
ncbi:double-stranded RNA-specific editase 1-like isoform X1 [Lucilia sericata]|uniref:double-stranded RNA-specific editase 1-like isoform X1 n=2 Tax=Lucilia sericata TaxID=13632 RepID=UPI0018A86BFD|nr:double-stranded RNA-specific editase 1-like isoform X1 [Lucilia sericata]